MNRNSKLMKKLDANRLAYNIQFLRQNHRKQILSLPKPFRQTSTL